MNYELNYNNFECLSDNGCKTNIGYLEDNYKIVFIIISALSVASNFFFILSNLLTIKK